MAFSGEKQVEAWAASGSRRHIAHPEDERVALQGRVEPECGREDTPMWEANEANGGTSEHGNHSKQRIDEEWNISGTRNIRQLEDLATWGSYMKEELDLETSVELENYKLDKENHSDRGEREFPSPSNPVGGELSALGESLQNQNRCSNHAYDMVPPVGATTPTFWSALLGTPPAPHTPQRPDSQPSYSEDDYPATGRVRHPIRSWTPNPGLRRETSALHSNPSPARRGEEAKRELKNDEDCDPDIQNDTRPRY